MVDLKSFYFQSKKVPNSTQGCIAMSIYWKSTWYEVSKKVRHTPYLLKTAEKNIFQIQHFRANFRFKAKKTKSQNHHLEMSDRIKIFSRIPIFACIMAEIIPPKIGDGDPSLGRPTPRASPRTLILDTPKLPRIHLNRSIGEREYWLERSGQYNKNYTSGCFIRFR